MQKNEIVYIRHLFQARNDTTEKAEKTGTVTR